MRLSDEIRHHGTAAAKLAACLGSASRTRTSCETMACNPTPRILDFNSAECSRVTLELDEELGILVHKLPTEVKAKNRQ